MARSRIVECMQSIRIFRIIWLGLRIIDIDCSFFKFCYFACCVCLVECKLLLYFQFDIIRYLPDWWLPDTHLRNGRILDSAFTQSEHTQHAYLVFTERNLSDNWYYLVCSDSWRNMMKYVSGKYRVGYSPSRVYMYIGRINSTDSLCLSLPLHGRYSVPLTN